MLVYGGRESHWCEPAEISISTAILTKYGNIVKLTRQKLYLNDFKTLV